jgi:hypothetical protein
MISTYFFIFVHCDSRPNSNNFYLSSLIYLSKVVSAFLLIFFYTLLGDILIGLSVVSNFLVKIDSSDSNVLLVLDSLLSM